MRLKIAKTFVIAALTALTLQLTACGTLLHPEREGQRGGRIDPGIAVLDGVGLLFFLIPGVIAFAVDFTNGTIYLPGGGYAAAGSSGMDVVKVKGKLTNKKIQQVILEETGRRVDLSKSEVHSSKELASRSALNSEVKFL